MQPAPREVLNRPIRPFGFRVIRVAKPVLPEATRGRVATLVDVGTAYGTPSFYEVAPNARLVLIDPVAEYRPHVEKITGAREGKAFTCALGRASGEVELAVETRRLTKTSAFDRTASTEERGGKERRRVPMRTLDAVVRESGYDGPYGLKIDREGMEPEVLAGGEAVLRETLFVLAEVTVACRFRIGYTFEDVVQVLAERRFRVANVLRANPGPDGTVRCVDLLFVRADEVADGAATA